MKNLLSLHEAVVVVLLKQPDNTASFETISDIIENRKLFPIRKGGISLSEQIRLRTAISSSKYRNLFEFIKPDKIKLQLKGI